MIGIKVNGSGNMTSKVMLVGEGPGRVEAQTGISFSGASGSELDYLYLRRAAKIEREDVYVTNLCKWRTDEDDSDPSKDDILRDEPELLAEIEVVNPDILVAVGKVAANWFLLEDDANLEKYHGIPIKCPRFPDKTLLVTFHPAAGLHSPERYLHLIYWDYQQLGRLIRGEIGVNKQALNAKTMEINEWLKCQ